MSEFQTILPRNSTSAERALEAAIRAPEVVEDGIGQIVTLKEETPPPFMLWLVWEYGLEELLPYIPDVSALIAEGLAWERIKGTPESLRMVFSWLHYGSPLIEEEEPLSEHWHEYMVDPGGVPTLYSDLQGVVRLAKLTSPVGTTLSRLFHYYDVRRFKLDHSEWGDLLSDYSGVWDPELGIVLSFGRPDYSTADLDATTEIVGATSIREHTTNHIYEDRIVWDFNRFGDVPIKIHNAIDTRARESDSSTVVESQFWTGIPWVSETWDNIGYFVRSQHYGDPA
jgi:P2-related tail formation protein